jgi:hypothetical protein
MVLPPASLEETVNALRDAPMGDWAAKDILRAAQLPPLRGKQSAEVAEKLAKIKKGIPISPVLLLGGARDHLVIADGYHRASAACRVDEDTRHGITDAQAMLIELVLAAGLVSTILGTASRAQNLGPI